MSQINSFKIESFGAPSAFNPNSIAEASNSKSISSSAGGIKSVYTEESSIDVSPNTFLVIGGDLTAFTVSISGSFTDGDKVVIKFTGSGKTVNITVEPASGEIELPNGGFGPTSVLPIANGSAITFTYAVNSGSTSAWMFSSLVNL